MDQSRVPVGWILVLIGIILVVVAIIFTQPRETSFVPDSQGFESNGDPRVQTLEQMLLVGDDAIFVDDQPIGASEVVVGFVSLSNPGYVVIHRDDDGLPGSIMGVSDWLLDGAEHFTVEVESPLSKGEIYYAMLYKDDGDQAWSAPKDLPVTDKESNIILMTFTTSEGASPQEGAVMP